MGDSWEQRACSSAPKASRVQVARPVSSGGRCRTSSRATFSTSGVYWDVLQLHPRTGSRDKRSHTSLIEIFQDLTHRLHMQA